MSLTSIFAAAGLAVASCAAVHVGFGAFGVEPVLHALGDALNFFDLSEFFGIEAGGHGHGGVGPSGAEGMDVHDHSHEVVDTEKLFEGLGEKTSEGASDGFDFSKPASP